LLFYAVWNLKRTNKMTKQIKGKQTILPVAQLSYPFLFRKNQDDKYSCCLRWAKDDKEALAELKPVIQEMKRIGKEAHGDAKFSITIRDGDTKPGNEGYYFCNMASQFKPGVVSTEMIDGRFRPLEEEEIWAGCKVRAAVVPASYIMSGNKGVTLYLQHVQLVAEGERLGGTASSVEDVFGNYATSDTSEDEPFEDEVDGLNI
jgi:hypothetical protein